MREHQRAYLIVFIAAIQRAVVDIARIVHFLRVLQIRVVVAQHVRVLYLGVSPRHFNREDMVLLASELNQDFCNEPRLTVLIFSDYQAAKSLVFTVERLPTYERDKAALRGGYDLDRVARTESVSFSPDPSKPRDEIRINLKP
jgi:hypothetical protein